MYLMWFIFSFENLRIPQSLSAPISISLALKHKYTLSQFPLKLEILQKMLPTTKHQNRIPNIKY